jgi:hypothetical protein
MEVLIRYNNQHLNDNDRWRLLVDGNEFVCAHIQISCQSETCMRPLIENGKSVEKYHIRAFNFNEIIFQFGTEGKLIVLLV